jgi:hypothetical protein
VLSSARDGTVDEGGDGAGMLGVDVSVVGVLDAGSCGGGT